MVCSHTATASLSTSLAHRQGTGSRGGSASGGQGQGKQHKHQGEDPLSGSGVTSGLQLTQRLGWESGYRFSNADQQA